LDLLDMDIAKLAKLLSSGEITSEKLTETYIENIEKSKVNYYETICKKQALAQAQRIDRQRKEGKQLGPLAGIPMAVADNITTKDILTTAGSKMLSSYIPPYNATVIERLSKEGAVLLGKLKIEEFNLEDSDVEAKAVSEKQAAYTLGTNIGGKATSIRPSYGTVSRYGLIGASSSFEQIGVTGKNIRDLTIVLNTITGFDRRDSTSLPREKEDYLGFLSQEPGKFKLFVANDFFKESINDKDKEKLSAILADLENIGAQVERVDLETIKYLHPAYKILASAEFASNAGRYDGIRFGYRAKDYEDREELYKNTRTEAFGHKAKLAILFGNYVVNGSNYKKYYEKAQRVRRLIKDQVQELLADNNLLLIPQLKGQDEIESSYRLLAKMAGLPVINLPCKKDSLEGFKLQLLGPAFREEQLIQVGYALEKNIDKGSKELNIND